MIKASCESGWKLPPLKGIFELAESRALELAWSFMLDYENSLNPEEDRKEWAELLSRLCIHTIVSSPGIVALAKSLIKSAKIKPRDALHVACAETGGCDYFVTCDDDLVRTLRTRRRAPKLRVIATNPVEFIRRQGESRG
jgi:predicted nucleic acid-binding protein